jgi:hypothetical protein
MLNPDDLKARVRTNAAVSIHSIEGTQFGVLRVLEGDRAMVELPSDLPLGVRASLRVELGTLLGTALCEVTAGRLLPTAAGEQARQLLRIVEVEPGDQERWTRWRRSLIDGGTFTDFSGIAESTSRRSSGSQPAGQGQRAGLAAAIKAASVVRTPADSLAESAEVTRRSGGRAAGPSTRTPASP